MSGNRLRQSCDPRSDMLFLRCCAVQKYYFENLASTQYPKNHCVWACHYGDRSKKQHFVLAGFQNSTFGTVAVMTCSFTLHSVFPQYANFRYQNTLVAGILFFHKTGETLYIVPGDRQLLYVYYDITTRSACCHLSTLSQT